MVLETVKKLTSILRKQVNKCQDIRGTCDRSNFGEHEKLEIKMLTLGSRATNLSISGAQGTGTPWEDRKMRSIEK